MIVPGHLAALGQCHSEALMPLRFLTRVARWGLSDQIGLLFRGIIFRGCCL